jgi:hypothetical protein
VRVETSAEVAVWGERWLSDFVNDPAIRAEERETREWLASHWRQWSLEAWINSAYQMQRVWGGWPHDEFNANHAANNHWFLYRRERNGLLIWRMYAEYREAGLPVPEPILQHFDEWWRRLERASGMKEIAEAIEMTGPKGGLHPFGCDAPSSERASAHGGRREVGLSAVEGAAAQATPGKGVPGSAGAAHAGKGVTQRTRTRKFANRGGGESWCRPVHHPHHAPPHEPP